ncbi:MAG: hypothetical protein H6909_04120 [Rickettsiaceae bacterium]|nr:hypothetical protein [Rickettsiaceae bacterium]
MNKSRPFYSKKLKFEGSEYILELYYNGTAIMVNSTQKIIFTPKDIAKYFVNNIEQLKQSWAKEFYEYKIILAKSFDNNKFYLCNGLNNYQELSEEDFHYKMNTSEEIYKLCSSLEEANNYFVERNKFEFALEKFINTSNIRNISNKYKKLSTIEKHELQKQFVDIYKKLSDIVLEHYIEAQNNGKKLLIAIGEVHNTGNSFAIELMLSKICHDLGIKTLMTEASELPQFDRQHVYQYWSSEIISGILQSILYKEGDWSIKPIDHLLSIYDIHNRFTWQEYKHGKACGDKTRAEYINKTIGEINENSLLIIGAMHLFDICNDDKLNAQYHILAVNTVPMQILEKSRNKIKSLDVAQKNIDATLEKELLMICTQDKTLLKFQKYLDDKKLNIVDTLNKQINYLTSPKILHIDTNIIESNISLVEIFEITLNTINFYSNKNNPSEVSYLFSIEKSDQIFECLGHIIYQDMC